MDLQELWSDTKSGKKDTMLIKNPRERIFCFSLFCSVVQVFGLPSQGSFLATPTLPAPGIFRAS